MPRDAAERIAGLPVAELLDLGDLFAATRTSPIGQRGLRDAIRQTERRVPRRGRRGEPHAHPLRQREVRLDRKQAEPIGERQEHAVHVGRAERARDERHAEAQLVFRVRVAAQDVDGQQGPADDGTQHAAEQRHGAPIADHDAARD